MVEFSNPFETNSERKTPNTLRDKCCNSEMKTTFRISVHINVKLLHAEWILVRSGITIGPADPALQGGAPFQGGRKIVRKCGTFFGKLNCCNSNCTRFRLELYIFLDFFRHFHYFVGFRFSRKHLIKLLLRATGGAKWANGAPAGGHPKPTFRHCTSVA